VEIEKAIKGLDYVILAAFMLLSIAQLVIKIFAGLVHFYTIII
jgi:hypothetical protein